MAKVNKKLLGILYPIAILMFFLAVYFTLIVNLYFTNINNMFGNIWIATISIIYLVLFHIFLALIVYCYLTVMFKNPGEPPQFWGFND